MLDSLRKLGSSILGKIMMAFLLVGLAGFGISGVLTTIGSNTIARVGNQEITVRDFQRAYSRQLDATAQQTGSVPTAEQAMSMGIPLGVLYSLADSASLDALGGRMGLGASDDRLGKILREDQNFAGVLGQFDRAAFQRALQSAGFTEAEYLSNLKKSAGRQQIVSATVADVVLPEAALDLINRYSGDKRTLSYYVLRPETIAAPAEPTEEELATYLKDNQQTYRTMPTRVAKFIVLTLDSLSKSVAVTDAEVTAEYEKNKASYSVPETRQIRQVVLNDTQKAAFEKGHADNKSFDALLVESGLVPTDLGTLSQSDITDTTLAETAFALNAGDFALIPGALGTRAVEVVTINPAGVKPIEDARADIEKRLKDAAARAQFADVLDQIEELRAAFKPLDEIAARFKLDIHEVSLTSSGNELSVITDIPAESDARVATKVFSTEMGSLAPTITLGPNTNVWFDLEKIVDARDQTLDEVRDAIKKTIVDARTAKALQDAADADVAAIKGGVTIDAAAAARNTFTAPSEAFSRNGISASAIDGNVATAAFQGPKGLVGSAANGDGDYVVFTVTDIIPVDQAPPAAARDYVTAGWRDTIYAAFVTSLRQDIGLSIAQNTFAQQVGLPTGK